MPREEVQWFREESIHDSEKIHAQQCCSYYSIVNINKANYPFLSSYEQEQTWTLTRTISNNHKRYQSSIENIHLTRPTSSMKTKHVDYENVKMKKIRSNSLLPPISLAQKYISSTSLHSPSINMNTTAHQEQQQQQQQEQTVLPIQTMIKNNSIVKNETNIPKPRSLVKPMRVIHSNGEFVVRI